MIEGDGFNVLREIGVVCGAFLGIQIFGRNIDISRLFVMNYVRSIF